MMTNTSYSINWNKIRNQFVFSNKFKYIMESRFFFFFFKQSQIFYSWSKRKTRSTYQLLIFDDKLTARTTSDLKIKTSNNYWLLIHIGSCWYCLKTDYQNVFNHGIGTRLQNKLDILSLVCGILSVFWTKDNVNCNRHSEDNT